jgi:hypothetical protein
MASDKIPIVQLKDKDVQQMQEAVVNKINQITSFDPLSGIILKDQTLASGNNDVPHKLKRKCQGWIITKKDAAADIYQSESSDDTKFLRLVSSGAVTVDIWVF